MTDEPFGKEFEALIGHVKGMVDAGEQTDLLGVIAVELIQLNISLQELKDALLEDAD